MTRHWRNISNVRDKVQRKHLEGSKNDEREKNASLKYIHNIYSDYIYILRLLYIYIYTDLKEDIATMKQNGQHKKNSEKKKKLFEIKNMKVEVKKLNGQGKIEN